MALSEKEKKRRRIERAMKIIVKELVTGVENTEEQKLMDLASTPRRVSTMLVNEMAPYAPPPNIPVYRLGRERACIVAIGPLEFSSLCAHHMLPFVGKAWVSYLPEELIVGLSKPARLIEAYAARLQMQERLTAQVLADLVKILKPKACLVVMRAHHGCMGCRGVRQGDAQATTQALYPPDGLEAATQDELYRAIERCGT